MISFLRRYTHWLHTQWPAGRVETLPEVGEDGLTSLPGVRVVGDLTGIPLLKFSADTGARAVRAILEEPDFPASRGKEGVLDLAIVGGGVSGYSAAIEAKKAGLNFKLFEAAQDFSTIANFPKGKPIYTYPTEMTPAGELHFRSDIKEELLEELREQKEEHGVDSETQIIERIERKDNQLWVHSKNLDPLLALRVIIAIGKSGNFRKLKVPGEDLDKVVNRLHDPKDFSGQQVLVVGGGDSAAETAVALTNHGGQVTLSYRRAEFSRPKPENAERLRALEKKSVAFSDEKERKDGNSERKPGSPEKKKDEIGTLRLLMESHVKEILPSTIRLEKSDGSIEELENDQVFVMTGREAPLDFFRRSRIAISDEWRTGKWIGLIALFLFCLFLYHWKGGGWLYGLFQGNGWFPFNITGGDSRHLLGALLSASNDPGFYYSFVYCLCVVVFGIRRIRRRKTPYVKRQTLTLMAFQVIPLFLLPYLLLPWMGANGVFDSGVGKWLGDVFFPDGSYWRAFGFILAWPLFIWNVFTDQPVWGWLFLSVVQTFVVIPWIVHRWGKGAYCGWVCSCGALAETLGDAHRHKMPHGPFWNRLNMVGQVVLFAALFLLVLRIGGWIFPNSGAGFLFNGMLKEFPVLNYKYLVDLWLAGILGVTFYFHFSGRIWCRFACPLAALMHVYARFSQFRIFAEKKKCISCNVCTSVCHQGIDVMSFANKGIPMEDPQCVRCSACVQSCPTEVLSFGRFDGRGNIHLDTVRASPLNAQETQGESLKTFLQEVKSLG